MNKPRDYLIKGTFHKLLGVFIKSISPVLTIFLAHFFSRETFGQYVSMQLMALTLSRLCLLGLDKGISWYIPRNVRENRHPAHQLGAGLYTALKTSAGVTVAALLALAAWQMFHTPAEPSISPFFGYLCFASIPALVVVQYMGPALEGSFQPGYRVWIGEFLLYAGVPPIALALRFLGLGRVALPLAFLLSAGLCAVLLLAAALRHFQRPLALPRDKLSSELRRYALPQGVSDLLSSLILRVDLWMVLFFLGPGLTAVYAIMLTLSNSVKTIRQSFDSLLLPVISRMAKSDRKTELAPAFRFTVGIVTLIQFFIALAVFFFPGEILTIAGKQYSVQPQALLILLVGNLVGGFFGLNAQVLSGMGRSVRLMHVNFGVLALNALLDLWWIPRFGLAGAAAASTFALLAPSPCWRKAWSCTCCSFAFPESSCITARCGSSSP
jgi:O-antigen/teichoic acid export membrane protein